MIKERWAQRLLMEPLNSWNWYEAAKNGLSLDDAIELANDRNIDLSIVRKGFKEFGNCE
ncbi:MAG: hypothetical protein PHU23_16485 [Dehalococcoidales bacterium]|nr:hypothetical protein [Dehalococcoidales bacterium]